MSEIYYLFSKLVTGKCNQAQDKVNFRACSEMKYISDIYLFIRSLRGLRMIHKTAEVSSKAAIGENTKIWHYAQVRENAKIGKNCILGKNVYIDFNVKIGDNVKIQNNASIYHGAVIEDGVFIGPNVCLTNDKNPRSINPDGSLKNDDDWEEGKIVVKRGASVGAGSTILPDVAIGEYAMIGAGSVVTKNIPDYCLAYGNPAKPQGYVCKCGFKVTNIEERENHLVLKCQNCNSEIKIKKSRKEKAKEF